MEKKIVTGIGELLWDLLPEGKQLGGAPCNFAFHAMQNGCESFIVSAVGNDKLGTEIIDTIHSLALSSKFIQHNSHTTGNVTVLLDENGQPDYTIHENVAWDFITWEASLIDLAKKTHAVCFGSLAQRNEVSEQSIHKFMNSVSEECLKVFDINLRQHYYSPETIHKSLRHANVLKLNDDELPVIASFYSLGGTIENQLKTLAEKFDLKYIAYTMGSKGSMLLSTMETSYLDAPKVKVKDTVGAGDAFTAVLIAGILNGMPLAEIHQKASDIAAFVCTRKGATPTLNT